MIYRNRVILYYEDVDVEIISRPSHLEIQMSKATKCKEVLELLRGEITATMNELPHMRSLHINFTFHCP